MKRTNSACYKWNRKFSYFLEKIEKSCKSLQFDIDPKATAAKIQKGQFCKLRPNVFHAWHQRLELSANFSLHFFDTQKRMSKSSKIASFLLALKHLLSFGKIVAVLVAK